MTVKKKVLTILLSVAGVCVVGAGVVYGVKRSQESEVMVIPVSDINNGGYWGDNSTMEGIITSDASQDVYLSDVQTVEQVSVKEGDTVKAGDVLLTYDMTLTNLNLEMQKLNRDQADLRIQVAKNDLKKLKNTKPVSENGGSGEGDDGGSVVVDDGDSGMPPEEVPVTEIPTPPPVPDAVLYNGTDNPLQHGAKPYKGEGSKKNPFRFLCEDKTVIKASFINSMMGYSYDENGNRGSREKSGFFYRLEVRRENKADGELLKAWKQDASSIEKPFEEDWEGVLDLAQTSTISTPTLTPPEENEPSGTSAKSMKYTGAAGNVAYNTLSVGNLTMKGTGAIIFTAAASDDKSKSTGTLSTPLPSDMSYTKDELAKAIKEKEAEIKSLELDLREQEIKLKASEKAVNEGKVVAGFNGVIKKVGDPENPPKDGTPFLVLSSTDGMYVKGNISELKLNEIKEGTVLNIMSYQSGTTCEATIKNISPYPSENYNDYSGTNGSGYPFTAYIASGGDQLQNNEYVEVSVSQQAGEGEMMAGGDTISISKAFIREEEGVKYVYIRGEDNRLKRQEVTTGRLFWGDAYEIKGGISQEDWIAFPYGKNVKEGAKTKEGSMNQLYGY